MRTSDEPFFLVADLPLHVYSGVWNAWMAEHVSLFEFGMLQTRLVVGDDILFRGILFVVDKPVCCNHNGALLGPCSSEVNHA